LNVVLNHVKHFHLKAFEDLELRECSDALEFEHSLRHRQQSIHAASALAAAETKVA